MILLLWIGTGIGGVWLSRGMAYFLPPLPPSEYLLENHSPELVDRNGRLLYALLDEKEQWAFPRTFDQMNPWLVKATLAIEDKRYWEHAGVDPRAVMRAALQNLIGRRRVSGASTITMQMVKRVNAPARTISDKFYQMLTALRLNRATDKQDLLRAYLNTAPYGGNLVGVEAAARRYFGKPAAELSLPEAALLAGLPKSPTAMNPLKHPERTLARRNSVLRHMYRNGAIDKASFEKALASPMAASWHDFPHTAPHLAVRLEKTLKQQKRVVTTLEASIQEQCEWMVLKHLNRFNGEITNAAIMVVDVAEGAVLARVGSAGFFSGPIGGQVDLCRRPRSPGSALKPFTYALALEKNRLYPTEQLLDQELDYGSYNPANFEGNFNGLISATDALRMSLNVPAVMILDRVGVEDLCTFLRRAGFDSLVRTPAEYGLGLTLGNCEVTLEALTGAYAMLANMGNYRPLRYLEETAAPSPIPLLSTGTAWALYTMLEQPFPEELDRNLIERQGVLPRVCWKTGTSTGFHDAWAVAYNAQYVVAVWMGNNSGKASRRLVGVQAALPLAAAVFRSLPARNQAFWPDPGDTLHPVPICSLSGLPAGESCPAVGKILLPKSLYLHRKCRVHQPDPQGGVMLCWPAMPRQWDLAAISPGAAKETVIAANTTEKGRNATTLAIISPPDKSEYVFTGEQKGDRIPLKSSRDTQPGVIHWYLDGRYLGDSRPQAPLLLDLTIGEHQLTCMDETGETASVRFTVHGG